MDTRCISSDGFNAKLTGNQVKFIRMVIGESQAKFAKRFAMSSASIFRLEAKGDVVCTGPDIILIEALAKQFSITVPEQLMRSPAEEVSEATS